MGSDTFFPCIQLLSAGQPFGCSHPLHLLLLISCPCNPHHHPGLQELICFISWCLGRGHCATGLAGLCCPCFGVTLGSESLHVLTAAAACPGCCTHLAVPRGSVSCMLCLDRVICVLQTLQSLFKGSTSDHESTGSCHTSPLLNVLSGLAVFAPG